jgi:Asp-tRNA(Asn)/Glu-tRNA(Gln) amidotransferase C subunit
MADVPLTKDALRALAQAQGLALSDADLDGLLPLVQALRAMMDELAAVPLEDVEPTSLYHML